MVARNEAAADGCGETKIVAKGLARRRAVAEIMAEHRPAGAPGERAVKLMRSCGEGLNNNCARSMAVWPRRAGLRFISCYSIGTSLRLERSPAVYKGVVSSSRKDKGNRGEMIYIFHGGWHIRRIYAYIICSAEHAGKSRRFKANFFKTAMAGNRKNKRGRAKLSSRIAPR